MFPHRPLLLCLLGGLLLAGCSPRNGFNLPAATADDDDDGGGLDCDLENAWPETLADYADYVGEGANTGDLLSNFKLVDQFGESMCLSQMLGQVLIVDASTRWCGPCNEAASESAVLMEEITHIGPSSIVTLMVQDLAGQPATSEDVEWWVDAYDIEYPVVVDNNQSTALQWSVTGYPLFLFVAPNGEVVERIESRPSEADVIEFVEFAVEEFADDLRPTAP